jgi:hypothetical protein
MTEQEKTEVKNKIQRSLLFSESELWNSVIWIVSEAIKAESEIAISQSIEESKRSHQAGRADGLVYFKDLLEQTRKEALRLSNRKGS